MRIDMQAHLERVRARKAELGIDDEALTDSLRNDGSRRTPDKRDLLVRIEARARAAGQEPLKTNY